VAREILVCDRCGFELTEKDDIALALEGMGAWQNSQRGRGQEPRGVFPCKYYFQCKGEMILVKDKEEKHKKGLFGKKN
jgi:hypothetical protein